MKIKMRKLAASASGVLKPDTVYDLDPIEAQALINAGAAVVDGSQNKQPVFVEKSNVLNDSVDTDEIEEPVVEESDKKPKVKKKVK